MTAPLIEIENLIHHYGDRVALRGLNLSVKEGEIVGLLGPNGSGKSTAFAALTGLIRPNAGGFRFRGQELPFAHLLFRREMGCVFQTPSLDPKLSAWKNLELSARLYGVRAQTFEERARDLLQLFELTSHKEELVQKFSGGMRRKLDLVRAILPNPAVLLMDEPTSGLDEVSFQNVWQLLHTLRAKEQLSILVITHRPEEAERCDLLALIDQGKIVVSDTPERLKERVSGDVLTFVTQEPAQVASTLEQTFQLKPTQEGDQVMVNVQRGHEWIPRLVEALPSTLLKSISMRKPTLSDVFVALTGKQLRLQESAELP